MTILQLNPQIPVAIVENPMGFPAGKATAWCLIDYGVESDVLMGIATDASGEIYWIPTQYVRFQTNMSMGRKCAFCSANGKVLSKS